ncbi:MAG: hypothetical protein H6729_00750 [Deltaproteobacteria bacterium]|nr:hypothetical protein [Deltaproteobacteria bacterium]
MGRDSGGHTNDGAAIGDGGPGDSGAAGRGDATPVDWPDDECQPPPPIDPAKPYDIVDATRFIYEGDNPIQTGVEPGTIKGALVAVIRGRVVNDAGELLSHVVVKIADRPEFGRSRTRNVARHTRPEMPLLRVAHLVLGHGLSLATIREADPRNT